MLTYIGRRVLYSIPVLLLSSFLSFTFVSLAGDPLGQLRLQPNISRLTLERLATQYHLHEPVVLRWWYWLEDAVAHKLGDSLVTLQPIWPDLQRTLGHTAQVVLLSEALALPLGLAIGILSAVRQYSLFDYVTSSFSFLGFAMPTFLLALLLQIGFVEVYTRWHVRVFYTSGLNSGAGGPTWSLDRLQHLALPSLTLCIVTLALYSRFMRASMLDVVNSDFVRQARAKGVPEWKVVLRHVLPNAAIPMVTVVTLNIGGLLGGVIITETVFTLDGLGYYFVQRLSALDVYAVMGYLMLTAVVIVLFNLVADVVYGLLDPRVRYD